MSRLLIRVNETISVAYDRWVEVKDPIHPIFRLPASIDSEDRVRLRTDELVELFGLGALRDKWLRPIAAS